MKKVLLGTTAIVAAGMIASSPASAAEKISAKVGGYMEQWIGYATVDQSGSTRDIDGFDIKSDSEIHFTGMTTLYNGIEFGVNVQLEANSNSGDQIDESYLIVKGSFGEINLGDENSAMYKMHYSPTDYGISLNSGDQVDWAAVNGSGITSGGYFRAPYGSTYVEPSAANDSTKLTYYTPRVSGFQAGVSYGPNAGAKGTNADIDGNGKGQGFWEAGVTYKGKTDSMKYEVAAVATHLYDGDDDFGGDGWGIGATIGSGAFSASAGYSQNSDWRKNNSDQTAWSVGAGYNGGAWTAALVYVDSDLDVDNSTNSDEFKSLSLQLGYNLGGGLTTALGIYDMKLKSNGATVNDVTGVIAKIGATF